MIIHLICWLFESKTVIFFFWSSARNHPSASSITLSLGGSSVKSNGVVNGIVIFLCLYTGGRLCIKHATAVPFRLPLDPDLVGDAMVGHHFEKLLSSYNF